jgi:hypothetical protein
VDRAEDSSLEIGEIVDPAGAEVQIADQDGFDVLMSAAWHAECSARELRGFGVEPGVP